MKRTAKYSASPATDASRSRDGNVRQSTAKQPNPPDEDPESRRAAWAAADALPNSPANFQTVDAEEGSQRAQVIGAKFTKRDDDRYECDDRGREAGPRLDQRAERDPLQFELREGLPVEREVTDQARVEIVIRGAGGLQGDDNRDEDQ